MRPFRLILLFLVTGCNVVRVPEVAPGLIDTADTLSLGLEKLPGAQPIMVHKAQEGGDTYANNVLLTRFKGVFYCMWQSSARDEDTPDTRVLLARSADGLEWSAPELLARPTDSTFVSPGGWIQRGDSLAAVLNYVDSEDRSRGGRAWFIVTHDGKAWTAPRPLRMADCTPMDGILEQDPLLLEGGRTVGAAHFRPGLQASPVWTDDPSALKGWHRASLPSGEGKPLEPSQYVASDGALVMFFRDQASSFRKLYSVSKDRGESWSAPALTGIPDSRSKQCAGTLPDGRVFAVCNPTGNKSRRALAIITSRDGYTYDVARLLLSPSDLPPRRFPGRYKTLGYSYPKAALTGDTLWVGFSINKEDVAVIPIFKRYIAY